MSTGLIEGWQHFQDGLRERSPLLGPDAWREALGRAGFECTSVHPSAGSPAATIGQSLVVAHKPGVLSPAAVVVAPAKAGTDAGGTDLAAPAARTSVRDAVLAALPMERAGMLRALVRDEVSKVLKRTSDDPPGPSDRLMELGFDSLMAVQLRGAIGRALGFDRPLPATLMFDHPTIEAIARFLDARLPGAAVDEPAPQVPATPTSDVAARVASLSDAEIEALLNERLGPA